MWGPQITKTTNITRYLFYVTLTLLISVPLSANSTYALSNGGIVSGINAARKSNGLAALQTNSMLQTSASNKAKHMCTESYWAHTAPDGTTGWDFMRSAGYSYITASENLAKGFSTDSGVVSGWMASAGHKANILSTAHAEVGVGSYYCKEGTPAQYIVVAHFGARTIVTPKKSTQTKQPVSKPPVSKKRETPSKSGPSTEKSASTQNIEVKKTVEYPKVQIAKDIDVQANTKKFIKKSDPINNENLAKNELFDLLIDALHMTTNNSDNKHPLLSSNEFDALG